jgi:hypothetical protein
MLTHLMGLLHPPARSPTFLFGNFWQMTVARHEALVTYGLHREVAKLFDKNLGCIPSSSFLYNQLVLVYVWSQLNLAPDILL